MLIDIGWVIPINVPRGCPLHAFYIRDGFMCVNGNYADLKNYTPSEETNSLREVKESLHSSTPLHGSTGHHRQQHPNSDFEQVGELYRRVMNDRQRDILITNIVSSLKHASREVQERQVKLFARADEDYGRRVAKGLGLPLSVCSSSRM
ncbi:peroxisomal catalase, putative [Eimeria acervulina]|uniref:Peroxisomal catalase, putative n=1 Tax=Eimeria acervulina TaxID=5801 RepID=U6GTS2_EIMAC|nr:peroxisomal catalase, putative [Eimeria acervulina]CDI83646.1 peroxisomal catalase, putative [Eimeria acervulina]